MKIFLSALTFATISACAAPSFAAEMMKCDDAGMVKVEQDAMAVKDKIHMEMAMKQVDMARMAMKDGKMEDCAMHMDGAMKETMMK